MIGVVCERAGGTWFIAFLASLLATLPLTAACTDRKDPSHGTLSSVSAGASRQSQLAPTPWQPREGVRLIGARAPQWHGIQWIQGGPLTLQSLNRRGRVVLLRFWLTGCPFCEATAPALNELAEEYGPRGLTVVGLHHPKSPEARDADFVRRGAQRLGFRFPIGLDNDWTTIRAYGVGTVFQRFTSVSFLIDRSGIIRFVHDGGEFHRGGGAGHERCNAAYDALVDTIEELLTRPRS